MRKSDGKGKHNMEESNLILETEVIVTRGECKGMHGKAKSVVNMYRYDNSIWGRAVEIAINDNWSTRLYVNIHDVRPLSEKE